jgi:DMSO/TMAO reductase YedYZ heme-binding membrane subunit
VKSDIRHPAIYATLVALLLGFRVVTTLQKLRVQRHAVQVRA